MDEKVELYEEVYERKFSFGKNWSDFLKKLNSKKIQLAKKSLLNFTKLENFKDKTFIDIGCGSGLFSLCAIQLGAKKVVSVDIDTNSLNCAKFLRKKFKINEKVWEIKKGSVLDKDFLNKLGKFDIVYSWGVLHHTGNMWQALKNIILLTKKESLLYIAIYNDFKGFPNSKNWVKIKKIYSSSPKFMRVIMEWLLILKTIVFRILRLKNPITYIKNYDKNSYRGMSFYNDIVDWLGGYPYEFASVNKIENFYKNLGFNLINLKKRDGTGCNEFIFYKNGKKKYVDRK
jgi:2-polyprenyl-6-hydroxyphenyl methylase/3-demethylubiquinone-9 3-methyltransferase